MASTFTTLLRLNKPALGDTGWGTAVNGGFTDLADSAIAGTTTLSTDADVTLTTANGAADQSRQMILNCTGSRAAQRTITAPATSKVYVVINGTTGGFGVKIVGVGPTTGVVVPNGRMAVVAWNGTDFVTLGAVVDLTATGNVSFDGGTFVFNESGADKDARFEGDSDPELLFLDASTDRVGISTQTPQVLLDVTGDSTNTVINIRSTSSGTTSFDGSGAGLQLLASGMNTSSKYTPAIKFGSTDADFTTTNPKFGAAIIADAAQTYSSDTSGGMGLSFWTAPTSPGTGSGLVERVRIGGDGNVGIGVSSAAEKLHVYNDQATIARFERSTIANVALQATDGTNSVYFGMPTGGGFAIDDDADLASAPWLYIDTSGNVGIGTTSPGAKLNVVANTSSDAVRITQTGAGNALVVEDDTNPDSTPFVINAAGDVVIGNTSTISSVSYSSAAITPSLQLQATTGSGSASGFFVWRADSTGAQHVFSKSRGATIGTRGLVSSGDNLGVLTFAGDDGTNFIRGALIAAQVDSTPGTNDMPGRLVFSTTPDGSATPTECMRLTSDGYLRMASGTSGIQFNADTSSDNALNDYEEGTWTPVLSDASTGGNVAPSGTFTGSYTKVGRIVTVTVLAVNFATTGMTAGNDLFIQGLPFTARSVANTQYFTGACILGFATVLNNPVLGVPDNASYMRIAESVINSGIDFMVVSEFSSGNADIYGTITYETA